jgi:2-C-methyl-D-erythritol 2,4-cyclodiphosphate synthase
MSCRYNIAINTMRIGFGFDTHRLEPGHDLWLGGVSVPHTQGAVGHSDADVLIHAVCDALFGAAGMRDIGFHFPDTDPEFKGIDSKILLGRTWQMIREQSFRIGNLDCTIVLQQPRIGDSIPGMIRTLARILETEENQITIKAKTSEKLGFIGREEGVSAYAVVLLTSI